MVFTKNIKKIATSAVTIFKILFKTFTILFKNKLIGRLLAFLFDVFIFFLICLGLAYLQFTTNYTNRLYNLFLPMAICYFLFIRALNNGNTWGFKIFKLDLVNKNGTNYKYVRLLFRTLLNIVLLLFFFKLYPIINYIFPFIIYNSQTIILIFCFLFAIPILNLVLIIQSNGSYSLIDLFSNFLVQKRNCPSPLIFLSIRKIVGKYLLISSFLFLLGLLVYWKFEPNKIFNYSILAPVFTNTIKELNEEDSFYKYSENDFPSYAFVIDDKDYTDPHSYITPHLQANIKTSLIIIIFLKRNYFDDKLVHSKIFQDIFHLIAEQNFINDVKIEQSKIILRRIGHFPPFTFMSEYTYLIAKFEGDYSIVGDVNDDIIYKKRMDYYKKLMNAKIGETIDLQIEFPPFLTSKAKSRLIFSLQTHEYPGINFIYYRGYFKEYSQISFFD